jgi:hypothetical protein
MEERKAGLAKRRSVLRQAAAIGGVGVTALTPLRSAWACHTYVSPVDGASGCLPFRRDMEARESPDPVTDVDLPETPECPPSESPPPPAAVTDSALPYGGRHVGCPLFAGNLGNTRYYEYHAYRFRAERTGGVAKIRWLNQFNLERPGYHSGNGGRISIEIHKDADGYPSGQILGGTPIMGPALDLGRMPLVRFSDPIQLQEGAIYHIVFRQHAVREGWISVDDLDLKAVPETFTVNPPWIGALASLAWRSPGFTSRGERLPPEWTPLPYRVPVFELHYTDGLIKGQGWVNGGRNHLGEIDGNKLARQELKIGGTSRQVRELAFVLYRRTAGGGDLEVRLEHSSGARIASMTVPRASISLTSGDYPGNPPMNWVKLEVPGTPILEAGQRYHVVFSAPHGSSYWAMPTQRGNVFTPFNEDKLQTLGQAAYSQSNGVSWTDWPVSWLRGYDRSWSLPLLASFA